MIGANGRPVIVERERVMVGPSAYGTVKQLEERGGESLVATLPRLAEMAPLDRTIVVAELEAAELVEAERLEHTDRRLEPRAPGLPSPRLAGGDQPGLARRGAASSNSHWSIALTARAREVSVVATRPA